MPRERRVGSSPTSPTSFVIRTSVLIFGVRNSYTREALAPAVAASFSVAEVIRRLGLRQAGGNHTHITRRIRELELDTSHFVGSRWNRGRHSPNRLTAAQLLIERPELARKTPSHRLRRALLEIGRPYRCEACGLGERWQHAALRLEIDHINGRHNDNRAENLRLLCPNCHSQTETFCARNIGRAYQVLDDDGAHSTRPPRTLREEHPVWLMDIAA